MSDPIVVVLRSAGKSNKKFFFELGNFRKKLNTSQFSQLISKVRRVRPGGKNGLISNRTDALSKRGAPPLIATLSLHKEIAWTCIQLIDQNKTIKRHIFLLKELALQINHASFEQALCVIETHMHEFGETLWGIEAKVGVLSLMNAQDLLDEYRDSRVTSLGSIPDFLLHVFEDIFDEDTSLGGFQRRMSSRLKGLGQGPVRDFLEARAGVGDSTDHALSGFLRISTWYTVIDAYEALISVLQHYFFVESNQSKYQDLLNFVQPLTVVGDIRLTTISSVLCAVSKNSTYEPLDADTLDESNPDYYPNFDAVAILALTSREKTSTLAVNSAGFSKIEKTLLEALLPFKEGRAELISTYEQLHTLILKFRFLPWYEPAQAWIDGLFLPIAGRLDYLLYCASCRFNSNKYSDLSSLIRALPWANVYGAEPEEGESYCNANERLLTGGDNNGFYQEISFNRPYSYGADLVAIAISLREEKVNETLRDCVQLAINVLGSSTFLPFATVFDGRTTWDDYEEFDLLDVVIGLYFISIGDRESRNRFLLEFACKKILGVYKEDWVVHLLNKYTASDPRIIFILREVLLPKNLRLVGQLRTGEQLEHFRIEICSALLDVDKDFGDKYIAETFEILQLQDMRKAERAVESSRINVDREGIKRWAEKTYREEFLHAKKSRTIKVAPTLDEIETTFREMVCRDDEHDGIDLSSNLKDPIFSIGYEIFQKCFWKEDDGLDHFLSLRIRHGSFAGYLRAPLEQARLVGSGTSMNDARSTYWIELLSLSEPEAVQNYIKALNKFQMEFDLLIEHFRNDLLQIQTASKPDGLFIPGLNKVLWDAYHHDWEGAKNFDSFFDRIWESFQTALDASLSYVTRAIDQKILSSCERLLVELRRLVSTSGLSDVDRATVISAVNEGGRALQEATRSVKKWFEVARDPVSETRLNAKQVLELAVKLFKKIRPSFVIEFSPFTVPQNVAFSRSNINRVTDALFIIFDNVYKHSGFDVGAKVDLIFEWIEDSSTAGRVFISATSEISADRAIVDVKRRLDEVRNRMNSAEHRNALVSEGRSGLIKLAWLATNAHRPGKIDFSVADDYRFNVEITMCFGFTAADAEGANANLVSRR